MKFNHKDYLEVFFDGACEPNPRGVMGYGFVIYRHKDGGHEEVTRQSYRTNPRPNNTNNVAEHAGLYKALSWIIEQGYDENTSIRLLGDSKLVIEQMKGRWRSSELSKCHNAYLHNKALASKFKNIIFDWIPGSVNFEADYMSRKLIGKTKYHGKHKSGSSISRPKRW